MKIIFSRAFLSDVTRKDTTITITKYFLGKTIIEKWFDNWDELTSDDFVYGFDSNQRTTERKVEGLWESQNKNLKLHLWIDEAEAYNINNSLMGYNIGFFYYKNAYGDENFAWILLPDDISLDSYTPGRFGFSEYTSLDLILGSNMIDIPTSSIPNLQCRIECQGESEETIFLEGHGVFRGIDPWNPKASDYPVYLSSIKDYIIGDKGTEFIGSDVFLSPEGVTQENPVILKIPKRIDEFYVVDPNSNRPTSGCNIIGEGRTLYFTGTYSWEKYKVFSWGWELIENGKDSIDTLSCGEIVYNESYNAGTGMVSGINWKNKSIDISTYLANNSRRSISVYIRVPILNPDNRVVIINSTPIQIYQDVYSAIWEIDYPGTSTVVSLGTEYPLIELIQGKEKVLIARTNQDFEINPTSSRPSSTPWVRLDLDNFGNEIAEEDLKVTIEKISHNDLWWELRITFLTQTQRSLPPLKYTLWMGGKPYEFFVYCGGILSYSVKSPLAVISSPTPKTFSISTSELLEVLEREIDPGFEDYQVFIKSTMNEDLEATISPSSNLNVDMVFASTLSHRLIIPAALPNLENGVWIPVKILGSGEETTGDKVRINLKPKDSLEEGKNIELQIKEGKTIKSVLPKPKTPSSLLHFHSLGNCLEGWMKNKLGTVIDEVSVVKNPELTYLLMWTKEIGYTQVEKFACFGLGNGKNQLLTHFPQNIGDDVRSGILILREWGNNEDLWSSKFIQGSITGKIDPQKIQLSGPKNSIFPVISLLEVKGIERELPFMKKIEDSREIITSIDLIDVEWLENSDKLELEGRRIEQTSDNKFFPVFNVSPKYYKEEFEVHVKLNIKITLDQTFRELYGVEETSITLPIDLRINKPKL